MASSSLRPEIEPIVRRLVIDVVTAEVSEGFRRAGIPCILLKGPALARWLYPPGEVRSYLDVDLLVPEPELPRAEKLLATSGFKRLGRETIPGDWPRHAHNWIHPDGTVLDLHYTLAGARVTPSELWDVISTRIETIVVANQRVTVLDEGARALLVALHSWKDGKVVQARRDLSLALERVSREAWEDATVLAARLQALDAFAVGLERNPAGGKLAFELGLPSHRSTAVALREKGAPPLAVGIDWFLRTPGWRGKAGLVVRKLFPPPGFLRDWSPLAKRGRLGLIAAYAWRPLWVLWHVGPAYWALLRARREARRRTGGP